MRHHGDFPRQFLAAMTSAKGPVMLRCHRRDASDHIALGQVPRSQRIAEQQARGQSLRHPPGRAPPPARHASRPGQHRLFAEPGLEVDRRTDQPAVVLIQHQENPGAPDRAGDR
jgi:uncharacterized caspase-like protein